VRPSRENPFSALGLHRRLARVVEQSGYRNPTPIQSEAIPHVLDGRDVLGCAQTGTGKTAAFALPILDHLVSTAGSERRRPVRALVLAPTRELAAQIADSFRRYGRGERLRTEVVFGGVGKRPQVQALRAGADVLVATPGRLLDLLDDRAVDLRQVEVFVLDEADRMLDMGFIHDVKRIAGTLPDERQTLLFSATMPNEIRTLADRLLADPVRVAVDPVSSTRAPIAQSVYFVERRRKAHLLLDLLKDGEIERALVFTRTKHGANRLAQKLDRARVSAAAIHGDKSQGARERALADFKRGRTRVVVATDVAARGIDVKDLSHVINFDLPEDPESYVHRVGRTGRAGRSGVAFSFCSGEERAYLDSIERLTKRKVERRATPEGFDAGDVHAVAARAARGRGSRRPRDAQETGLRRKTSHRRTSNRAEGGRRRR
jgi:ATP-dependent RNA helicase RhlE